MSKQEKLINYYTEMLENVKKAYADDWRMVDYIKQAEKDLEEVKNGRNW